MTERKSRTSFVENLLTGGLSAAIAKTAVAPVDRLKILLQLQHTLPGLENQRTKGAIGIAQYVLKEQGFFAFWRGNGTNVIRYFPTQALNFAFKEKYNTYFKLTHDITPKKTLFYSLLSGGLAGATTECCVYPLDFVRTLLVSDMAKNQSDRRYTGIWNCIVSTVRNDGGVRSLYRGLAITLCGIIPYRAIYFGGYDMLKKIFIRDQSHNTFFKSWGLAQVNTTFAQFMIYPLDTIRRRMIVHGGGEKQLYNNSFHCVKKIFQEEGGKAFYKGATANIVRATGGALCMAFYDTIKRWREGLTVKSPNNSNSANDEKSVK